MRKLLDLLCLLLGGLAMLLGAGLLMLFWLGPKAGMHPGREVLFAGAAATVVGAAVFALARGGRTWPAWGAMLVLVGATFTLGQTSERWLPYVSALGASRTASVDEQGSLPILPVAGEKERTSSNADKTAAKQEARPNKASPNPNVAEGIEITPAQFLSDHIEPALKEISKYEGYVCTFHKREWAKPLLGGYRLTNETITLKVRHDPASAYLYFHEPKEKAGTEAIYVEGKNGGNVIAHSTKFPDSLLRTINVPPTDAKVMANNRYPITNIGLKNLMQKFKNESEKYKDALKEVTFRIMEDQKIDKRVCTVIEIWNSNTDKYPRASARLYIDKEWNIPVGFESYEKMNGKETLVEYYRYTNMKFNPGFKEIDFDAANPAYGYP